MHHSSFPETPKDRPIRSITVDKSRYHSLTSAEEVLRVIA